MGNGHFMARKDEAYLHDIPLDEAKRRFDQALEANSLGSVLGMEEIELTEQAVGRVTAAPVWAKISSPNYHSAAMDGFAVHSTAIQGAMPTAPVTLEVGRLLPTSIPVIHYLNGPMWLCQSRMWNLDRAGCPLKTSVTLIKSAAGGAAAWSHVRAMGEEYRGHAVNPAVRAQPSSVDLGAAAASGHTRLQVARKPKVAILPTGTELVPIGSEVRRGDIIEYNSLVLAGQVALWGGEAARFPIIRDDFEAILAAVRVAAEAFDLILLNAGSSAGAEDYSARVIAACGQVLVHGVAVRPGHPVIIGMVERKDGRRIPIFGVPGYPVSATLTGEIFVEPLLARWTGRLPALPIEIEAEITRKVTSPAGDDDYLRVVVGQLNTPAGGAAGPRRGSYHSLVRADALPFYRAARMGSRQAPELRSVYTLPAEIERTIFAVARMILPWITGTNTWPRGRRLVSANVGSLAALLPSGGRRRTWQAPTSGSC